MCRVCDRESGKWRKEEIRVGGDGLIKGVFTMLDKHVQVIVGNGGVLLQVVEGLEFLYAKTADIAVVD